MNRRRAFMVGGVAVAATAAGLGWALRRAGRRQDAPAEMWQLRFPSPDGAQIALASFRGHPLVLNFWATWCAPCVKEMPELERFHRAHAARDWRVLGLAIDTAGPVREFLGRVPVSFSVALAGLDGAQLARDLGNAAGGLPFTAVFDGTGALRRRKLGETTFSELSAWAAAIGD